MTLRELMIERILFNMTEEDLQDIYDITVKDLQECSDEDFLDTYEEIFDSLMGY